MTKYLVVNADDLGISVSTNLAIRRAFREGIVTSTSLMANMPAFQHAVDHVVNENPGLGIGIHLCLTSGRPVLKASEVPLLVDGVGCFNHGFVGLARLLRSSRRGDALAQIADELDAQARRIDAAGIDADHVNSHQHVHMIPQIFELAAAIARARKAAIRVSDEAFRFLPHSILRLLPRLVVGGVLKKMVLSWLARSARRCTRDIASTDHFIGVLDSGKMTLRTLRGIFQSLPDGVTEVVLHPGTADAAGDTCVCSPQDRRFLRSSNRSAELAALLDRSLRTHLAKSGIALARFRDTVPQLRQREDGPAPPVHV